VLGAIQAEQQEKKLAELTHKKAVAMSRNIGNVVLEAEGWYYLGEIHARTDESIPGKIKCYEKSMQLYWQGRHDRKTGLCAETGSGHEFLRRKSGNWR
jgi:hypothetical protein